MITVLSLVETKNRGERGMRRKPGRPRVDSEDVHVRLTRLAVDALDAWIAAQPEPRPTRPEAIRRLLAEALGRLDAVKSPELPPGRTPLRRRLDLLSRE
jgi:hypothetical protein